VRAADGRSHVTGHASTHAGGKRRGYGRRADIPQELLDALERGEAETATLVEALAMDLARTMTHCLPGFPAHAVEALHAARNLGITRRMALAGELLARHGDQALVQCAAAHPSDTVRGWATYAICTMHPTLGDQLNALRTLADDPHFGVREWAWMALRPHLARDVQSGIAALVPWTTEPSAFLRRFASEATRPRGVWAAHLRALTEAPWLGLPILEPLRADADGYVQDSVANWLNDAARSQPDWVMALCDRWQQEAGGPATQRILRRALRNLTED
jgi:3-methyladenine DNA glycosylase AlkC